MRQHRCLRTVDRIRPQSIVRFPGFDTPETVRRVHDLGDGLYLVRTIWNLHYVRVDVLLEVLAVFVPGLGFVTPIREAA
jgi:hypothetical protein